MRKKTFILLIHYSIGFILVLENIVIAILVLLHPITLHLRYALTIPFLFNLWNLFRYYKLHSDNVPVFLQLVPTFALSLINYIFFKTFEYLPLILLTFFNMLYLFLMSYKAADLPFVREESLNND